MVGRELIVAFMMTALLALCSLAFSDEVSIPFGVHKDNFIEDMRSEGLDLTGEVGSAGFVEDKGMRAEVMTYRSLTGDELTLITQAALRNHR